MEYLSLAMRGFRSEVIGFPFPWGAATKSRNSASGLLFGRGKTKVIFSHSKVHVVFLVYLRRRDPARSWNGKCSSLYLLLLHTRQLSVCS